MLSSLSLTILTFLPLFLQFRYAAPTAGPISHRLSLAPINLLEPERCIGNCSHIHDPHIIYQDDLYWRFSTSGNIAVATSRDLQGPWTYKGALLQNGTRIRIRPDQDIWVAPSVAKIGDTFYCHYSVSFIGSHHSKIGVATSKSLMGGWTDHGALGLPQNKQYNLIDPHLFQEDSDASIYFTFGSYWSGIQQVEMKDQKQLVFWSGQKSDIKNVIHNSTAKYAVQEGATMYKNEDYYYMFFSVGQCCRTEKNLVPPGDEYHVSVCRADEISGPYFDADGKNCLTENGGTTILESHGDIYAPGGQGVMLDPKSGKTVIYYHYVRPSMGYAAENFFFGFNFLEWENGWPVLVESSS
ncbi:glycosyl hydrolase [Phaeosphaeriaceae sp. PMI808]|nr:glycosyl hydrolase [Phaeosphaeriaceae sp. PMI808]